MGTTTIRCVACRRTTDTKDGWVRIKSLYRRLSIGRLTFKPQYVCPDHLPILGWPYNVLHGEAGKRD